MRLRPAMAAPRHHHGGHRVCTQQASPADIAAAYVQQKIGAEYVFGASGPNAFDASGLVVAAYAAAGLTLPHNTEALLAQSTLIGRDDLQAGDLVFYGTDSPFTVAVYIGNEKVVAALRAGVPVEAQVVDFDPVYAYGRVVSS